MGAFINRATHEYQNHQNKAVRAELTAAGIPVLYLPNNMNGEVKTHCVGLLNGFVFTRAWRYWVCTGDMPLENAREIYQMYSHLGVRAEGHADNIEPIGYSPDYQEELRQAAVALQARGVSANDAIAELKKLKEDPNAPRYVRLYHIDTSEGLEALAQYIKDHKVFAHNGASGSYTASVFPNGE